MIKNELYGPSSSALVVSITGWTAHARPRTGRSRRLTDARGRAPGALEPTLRALPALACAVLFGGLTACATTEGDPVRENLDPQTGNTAVVLSEPMQLVTDVSRGPQRDPFAAAAPVVIDHQGERRAFLWMSVPADNGAVNGVEVLCGNEPLAGTPRHTDPRELGLTHPPYQAAAPWNTEWYLPLDEQGLKCLGQSTQLTVVSHVASGGDERFSAGPDQLKALARFTSTDAATLR